MGNSHFTIVLKDWLDPENLRRRIEFFCFNVHCTLKILAKNNQEYEPKETTDLNRLKCIKVHELPLYIVILKIY